MSTELSNGVIIPEEYSDDWYDEMSINLRKLNDVITAASDNATDIQRLDTDKANQSDLTALTSRVSQNETDIIALQTAVSGALKREIVQSLPTEDISTTTIYMIRNSESSGTNIYDEYMYINSQWELIGTSATDFSNYYTKTETDNLLSDKANDADAVHKSGAETIAGLKTFTDLMSIDGDYLGTEASTNQRTNLQLRSNRDTEGKSGALITRFRQNRTQGGMQTADFQMIGFDFLENEVRTNNILSVQATGWADSVPTKVYIVSSIGDYSYGNSARPCKINDNNPGALSLPDISAGVDISGYITAGNTHNEYTPTVDGWISVIIKKTTTSGPLAIFVYQGDIGNSYFGNTALPNDTEFCGMASIPVKAGAVVNIDLKGNNTYVYSAKFYPCQGNV